jgi:hypothetical protein
MNESEDGRCGYTCAEFVFNVLTVVLGQDVLLRGLCTIELLLFAMTPLALTCACGFLTLSIIIFYRLHYARASQKQHARHCRMAWSRR